MTDCAHCLIADLIRDFPYEWSLGDIPVVCCWCQDIMTFAEWIDLTDSGGD